MRKPTFFHRGTNGDTREGAYTAVVRHTPIPTDVGGPVWSVAPVPPLALLMIRFPGAVRLSYSEVAFETSPVGHYTGHEI